MEVSVQARDALRMITCNDAQQLTNFLHVSSLRQSPASKTTVLLASLLHLLHGIH